MAVRPTKSLNLVLRGKFVFTARTESKPEITDAYMLRIEIPSGFPKNLPQVTELGNKIPRNGNYHVNGDGTLCLGSPLRLLLRLSKNPTVGGYASDCLVPYLYAISHKLTFGGELPFSELGHGTPGMLQDYVDLFSVKGPEQARLALRMLGLKKRRANKHLCPCGCGKKLGKCRFHYKINEFRKLASRAWFKAQLN